MKKNNKKKKIKLGVNIDHAATLRQVRANTTSYPDLVNIAKLCLKSGADQITIHLREDRRHIQESDLKKLSEKKIPLNLEMAMTNEMLLKALRYKPKWCCLVPEKREELTTEGGLNLKVLKNLNKYVHKLKESGIKVSVFIEPDIEQVKLAKAAKVDAIEFHTGSWVLCENSKFIGQKHRAKIIWKRLVSAAKLANELNIKVHAGHGLDYKTLKKAKNIPYLSEVNIGHSIICYSLELGISKVIKKMNDMLQI